MPDETKPAAPESAKPSGPRDAAVTIIKSTTVGLGGSAAYALAMHYIDPTDPSSRLSGLVGVILGGLSGYYDLRAKDRRNTLVTEAEGRRLMIEAEAGEDRRLRVEAEHREAEVRRMLAACEAEKADVIRRLEAVEKSCRELQADMRDMRIAFEGERRELMADLRAARTSTRELADEGFRHDPHKGPPNGPA